MHARAALTLIAATHTAALAFDPDFGTEFATITHANNPAWVPPAEIDFAPYDRPRGSVGYEYRIAKTEITTAQWIEFINVRTTRSDEDRFFGAPALFGGAIDDTYTGPGRRYVAASDAAASWPVLGIGWRDAAIFCNWMHNGRQDDPETFLDGAYDTSTFGVVPGTRREFTDVFTHEPDAKYWITTLDEHIKASYWSPPSDDAPEGRWWTQPNGSDTPLVPGLPGEGQTLSGLGLFIGDAVQIPVGSYPDVSSPWGLLDVSGSGGEWLEEVFSPDRPRDRGFVASSYVFPPTLDLLGLNIGAASPFTGGGADLTLRLASAIPPPATSTLTLLGLLTTPRRRRALV